MKSITNRLYYVYIFVYWTTPCKCLPGSKPLINISKHVLYIRWFDMLFASWFTNYNNHSWGTMLSHISFFWTVSIIIEQQIMLINCRLKTKIVMYNIYIYSCNHLIDYTLGVWSWNRIAWMIINVTTTLYYQQVPLSKVHVILLLSDCRHPPSHIKSLSHERWNLFWNGKFLNKYTYFY